MVAGRCIAFNSRDRKKWKHKTGLLSSFVDVKNPTTKPIMSISIQGYFSTKKIIWMKAEIISAVT